MVDARVNLTDSYQRASEARPGVAAQGLQRANANTAAIASALRQSNRVKQGLEARYSSVTGGARLLRGRNGSLTAAAPGRATEGIVRDFLSANGDLYGLSRGDVDDLVALGDSPGGASALRMLRMEQRIDGRPVFQSETRFLLDRDGRLLHSTGLLVPNARAVASMVNPATSLSAQMAFAQLMASVGKTVDAAGLQISPGASGELLLFGNDPFIAGPVTAREVWFPLGPGFMVPAWSLVVFTAGREDWYAVVDAQTGDLLWRKNIRNYASAHDARFRVYVQADGTTPADSPAPQSPSLAVPGGGTQAAAIAPTIVRMQTAMDIIASPNGWIDDCPGGGCTANQTQTLGNNVLACLDRVGGTMATTNVCDTDAASVLDGSGRPTGNPDVTARNRDFLGVSPRDFEGGFLPPPQGGNPESGQTATGSGASGTLPIDSFRRGMVTHLFYLTNWYHDKLYRLGFDEASGNFQQTNFSGTGLGGDRVLADAQDSSGTNNANFSTPPDGTSGRMQMFRFTGPTIDRDGSLDAEIVFHELTHGTSNRLVGNGAGLNWDPAAGLGEGWSDFYALSLLNNTNADDPNATYASGGYSTYKLIPGYLDNYVYGIRRFPYSTLHAVNPMTWTDVDDVTNTLTGGIAADPVGFNFSGGMEVHNAGEIWALTLWGVRSRIIADPAGANGSVPTGNQKTLQLITDALKMTPIDPTFTEARDAIIDADCATNTCANEASIWSGFADRGLGYGASAPYYAATAYAAAHMGIKESFSLPFLDVVNVATDVMINDAVPNNNNGAIDPGEAIKLTVKLTNPWRAAAKAVTGVTTTLSTTTPGITIYDNTSNYGAIAPQGSAAGDTFMFTVAPGVPCGSAIDFTLTAVSNLGTTATTFQLRVGTTSGTNPVVTYTGTPSPALAIPDNSPRGVKHQINVTDDFVIADLNFRIDSLTHTWTGDLTAMLRSPNSLGVDLVSLIGVVTNPPPNGGSSGDNITNMVIDDDIAVTVGNDMASATAANAPYTRSWQPIFNSPWATTFGYPSSDPAGNLTRYNGTSIKGVWSILVSDQAPPDTGTLNGWSILVTPVKFVCAAVVPSVNITALKTVAGAFKVGGTVTYTVSVTNNGTANQADNPGNEFTDVLPAGLTLVSATATSGTAVATIGTNSVTWNGSLAPLGGSVTLTITATVNAGTGGTTISNQGSVAFDADANGSNEATVLTDDPAVAGSTNPTNFKVVAPPTIANAFGAATIQLNGSTSLTLTVANPAANAAALTGLAFTDALPAGLLVATPNGLAGTCGGTRTAVAGSGSVSLSGAMLASNTSCTVVVNVTGTTTGTKNNSTTATSTESGPGVAGNATLGVYVAPTLAKAFGGPSVALNAATALTFTVVNPNPSALTGVNFIDTLPSGLVVATPNGLSGTCGGGTITATAASASVSLSGAALTASTMCVFSVNVRGTSVGVKNNTTGAIGSAETGAGATASASITVIAPPTIAKAFGHPNLVAGGATTLTFTLANPAANVVALTGIAFSDTLPGGLIIATPNALTGSCGDGTINAVAGSGSVSLSGATLASGVNCVFSVKVIARTEGNKNNTTDTVTSTNGGTGAASNTATVTVSFKSLDIDASAPSTLYDPLTDGLLVIRYLQGVLEPGLSNAVLGSTATRFKPDLKTYLDDMRPVLDIDGDGSFDAQTDGLLVLRYMLGLRGAALLQDVVFSITATRTTAVDIEAFLAAMTP